MATDERAQVLVVDDEPALQELLADALAGEDVEVTTVGSADEAVRVAGGGRVDVLVTDIFLGDGNGLEVIDRARQIAGDIPAVVITGRGDARTLCEASRRRPVEMITKPLDLQRLRAAVRTGLGRVADRRRRQHRSRKLRRLARSANRRGKSARRELETTCTDLTAAYRDLSSRVSAQNFIVRYQQELLACRIDDDVFRLVFRTFVRRSAPVSGVAMVCDDQAELKTAGRFGVPEPDSSRFCELLARPLISTVLANPVCTIVDAGEQADLFDLSIRRYLVGVSALLMPLMPAPGEMNGLVILYRKGEQPFTDDDLALADAIAAPTAITIQRND